mmetsp:Transcript_26240/g.81057  ORF Transcript_26240/g.81057 Transcript_26240/m.81057 type:complete len:257 (-) Transcript_26240:1408-2178(-)
MWNFCTFCALLTASPLALSSAARMCARHAASSRAADTVVTSGFTASASPTSSSVNAPVSRFCFDLSVTRHTLYLRLSPTMTTLDSAGQCRLIASSTGTGAMFSPPAVMMSSLMRPVMYTCPSASMRPTSPEWSHPSPSMVSCDFSALFMYPIMTWRPRKQISPSPGLSRPSWCSVLSSIGNVIGPHEPNLNMSRRDMVPMPAVSLIPYTSSTSIPIADRKSSVCRGMGAAPVRHASQRSSPSASRTVSKTAFLHSS